MKSKSTSKMKKCFAAITKNNSKICQGDETDTLRLANQFRKKTDRFSL